MRRKQLTFGFEMLRNLSSLSSPFSMTKTDCSLGTSETKRGGEKKKKKKKDERQSSSKSAVKRGIIQREMRYWRGKGVEGRNPFWFAASFVFPSTPSAARTREKREEGKEEPLQINPTSLNIYSMAATSGDCIDGSSTLGLLIWAIINLFPSKNWSNVSF